MPTPHSSPRLRLTRHGRLVRTVLVLVLLLMLVAVIVRGCARGAGADGEATPPAAVSDAGGGAPAPSGNDRSDGGASDGGASDGGASAAGDRRPGGHATTTDPDGVVHSDMQGTGEFTTAPAQSEPPAPEGDDAAVVRYTVRVEGGTGIDPGRAAQEIQLVLSDPRGWGPIDNKAFQRIADPAEADVTITIAAPETVDRLCAPLKTVGTWNCHNAQSTVLNADRWLYLTPTYTNAADYHRYQVNHEVGHYLGHGHVACPGPGIAAPVMLQQSMDLQGCRANPWPADDGAA